MALFHKGFVNNLANESLVAENKSEFELNMSESSSLIRRKRTAKKSAQSNYKSNSRSSVYMIENELKGIAKNFGERRVGLLMLKANLLIFNQNVKHNFWIMCSSI